MFRSQAREDRIQILRFGGGFNSRKSEDEIDSREASAGYNFNLDVENTHFEPRRPFSLVGTATNTEDIRGYAQLVNQDGSLSILIQAGGEVYEWDGTLSGFTLVGTVPGSSKLRGPRHSNFTIDERVIITDLSLDAPVMHWDGTSLIVHPTGLDDEFRAKYSYVSDSRLWFANVISGGGLVHTPHMIVGSTRENSEILSVSDRPASSLGEDDPFFILTPDFRPVNGMLGGLNRLVFSSQYGSMYSLTGVSAKDFAIDPLYQDSAATGVEALVFAGNDFLYGRAGFIESLAGSERFGDIDNDNVSRQIEDILESYENFRLVYNGRRKKLFVLPENSDTIYVFYKPLYDKLAKDVTLLKQGTEVSPWVPWVTDHAAGFQPSCIWSMLDPDTRLEEVFFGDTSGNIYRMDAEYGAGDGGTTAIKTKRISKSVISPLGKSTDASGWVRYRPSAGETLTINLYYGGKHAKDTSPAITLNETADTWYFGGDFYFGQQEYWNSKFEGRILEKDFGVAGISSEFKVGLELESEDFFSIAEVGIEFEG